MFTRLKPTTICIAAICEVPRSPTILFCADRLVSAGIQFEIGTSKIISATPNSIIMESSADTPFSELILSNFRTKIDQTKNYTMGELSSILSDTCKEQREKTLDQNVVFRYNLAVSSLKVDASKILENVINELRTFPYPDFEFIVCGLDDPRTPHIFTVDQDGNVKSWDFLGFAVIGSGGSMALSELTKYQYLTSEELPMSLTRIYFAKKSAERAVGVGVSTDYGILAFRKTSSTEPMPVTTMVGLDIMTELQKGYVDTVNSMGQIMTDTANKIITVFNNLKAKADAEKAKQNTAD